MPPLIDSESRVNFEIAGEERLHKFTSCAAVIGSNRYNIAIGFLAASG